MTTEPTFVHLPTCVNCRQAAVSLDDAGLCSWCCNPHDLTPGSHCRLCGIANPEAEGQ